MTQAISGKNQVSNQAWRRHTDPPGLWLSVVIASVLLHLGGIWLIRFSGVNFALQPDSASVIPIDFVEVAPVKTATKSVVSRKSKSPRPKPRVSSTKQVNRNNFDRRVNPRSNVGDGIALTDNTTKKRLFPKSDRSTHLNLSGKNLLSEKIRLKNKEHSQIKLREPLAKELQLIPIPKLGSNNNLHLVPIPELGSNNNLQLIPIPIPELGSNNNLQLIPIPIPELGSNNNLQLIPIPIPELGSNNNLQLIPISQLRSNNNLQLIPILQAKILRRINRGINLGETLN
ncbi:hypothetical protein [Calothrix rhizosoleniae]|uniref:hypothetical protein n=1 Tax=Calothrix rhizosoleniae TaxID=888997 RepID=UPI000B4A169A|nr:hypothetical protein [Calothrix rhizosoleniae]